MASISLRLLIPFVCSFVSLFGAEPAVGRPPEGETPAAVSSASLAIDPQAQQFRPVITIAELDTLVNPYDAFMLRQTAAALQRALPKYFVRTVTIADAEAKTQIERLRPDFLLRRLLFRHDRSRGCPYRHSAHESCPERRAFSGSRVRCPCGFPLSIPCGFARPQGLCRTPDGHRRLACGGTGTPAAGV